MTMQHIRTRVFAVAAAVLMAMAGVWSASPALASGAAVDSTALARSADAHEAGRDLFKALYFGVGPAVDGLRDSLGGSTYSSFAAAAEQDGERQLATARAVADALEAEHPGLFAKANETLRSGDVFAVQRQLQELNGQLASLLESAPEYTAPQCLVTFAVVAAYVWDAAAAVNYAVAVNVGALAVAVAAVYAELYFWPEQAEDTTQLAAEEAVAAFTKALAD